MQKAAEAEAAAAAEAENAAEAEAVATADAASTSTAGRKYRTETTRTGHTHAVADPNAPLSSLAASPEAAERAAAREDAVEDTPRFLKLRATLIALTVPLTVLMIAIRAVASAPFLWLEYHRPGFPEDSYGYYLIERMRLGSYGVDYINNFAPREYLARVTTGADNTLAFTEAEVNHMHDVKWVLLIATVAVAALFLLTLLSSISLRERAPEPSAAASSVARGLPWDSSRCSALWASSVGNGCSLPSTRYSSRRATGSSPYEAPSSASIRRNSGSMQQSP